MVLLIVVPKMEDNTVLEQKLHEMISIMKSNRRKRLGRYCNWALTSKSLFENVFKMNDVWSILEKGGKRLCFTVIHQKGCEGPYDCSCTETVADPIIKVFYFSDFFTQMISVSHFQLYFSGNWRDPSCLTDIIDGINVSSKRIMLFDIGEAETEYLHGRDPEHGVADDKEFEKEQSPDFQRMLDEYNSLICEYVKLALTEPTSLPPFLLDVDEGPTMPLSKLLPWLESK